MAIDPVKKVWLVCPTSKAHGLPHKLAEIGLLHVASLDLEGDEAREGIARLNADTRDLEATIRKLSETLAVLSEFSRVVRDLLSNLIPTPVETTRGELEAALAEIEVDELHREVKALAARRAEARAAIEKAEGQLAAIADFRSIPATLPAEGELRWTQADLWLVPAKQARRVIEHNLGPEGVILEELATLGNKALVASVGLRQEAGGASTRLRDLGFEPVPPPAQTTTLDSYVAAIERELAAAEEKLREAEARLKELGSLRHKVELVLGHWEEQLNTTRAVEKMVATGRAAIMTGFVREKDLEAFQRAVAEKLPEVSTLVQEPEGQERVPVSLSNARVFRPAQFLVEMFGLPDYRAFDPTAFLMISFVVFFGTCLGDAVYGLVLLAISLRLAKRYRDYPGLRNFFNLLAYCGVSSFVVGALTGTWAADVWKATYLGEGNIFGRFVSALAIGDPLDKPLMALGVALTMGIANQFWGITMRMYRCWRAGDKWGALFDGGFWLLLLPGMVLLIAAFFVPGLPPAVKTAGMVLALVGAGGLVLTQGRHEKSLVGKIVVGIVSLYGIVGSYGCVAFIGDTLSYSRLLALGLTTAIVGMAVNIIAGMLRVDVAVLGTVLFLVVAVPGHFFNLLISSLGAFIHSARLIFVEFFGRFYEPGAERFTPLGAVAGRVRVVDRA